MFETPGDCATASLATPPADRGYCSRTGQRGRIEEALPEWSAGEGWRGVNVLDRAGGAHTAPSEPSANSPEAVGHAHHGREPLPTCQSQPRRAQVCAARALPRAPLGCRQRAHEGAWGLAGDSAGGGIAGRALGRPLPPSARPTLPPGAPDYEAGAGGAPYAPCSAHGSYL